MSEGIAGTYHFHNPSKEVETKETIHIEQLPSGEVIYHTKHGHIYKTRHGRELIPTPSNDPNDPLNWPMY